MSEAHDWPKIYDAEAFIRNLKDSLIQIYNPDRNYQFLVECLKRQSKINISKLNAMNPTILLLCKDYNVFLDRFQANLHSLPYYPQGDFVDISSALKAFLGFYEQFYDKAIKAIQKNDRASLKLDINSLSNQLASLSSRFDSSYGSLSGNLSWLGESKSKFESLYESIKSEACESDATTMQWIEKLENKSKQINKSRLDIVRHISRLADDEQEERRILLLIGYLGGDGTDGIRPLKRSEVCSIAPELKNIDNSIVLKMKEVLNDKCSLYAQLDEKAPELVPFLEMLDDFIVVISHIQSIRGFISKSILSLADINAQVEIIKNRVNTLSDSLAGDSATILQHYLERTKEIWEEAITHIIKLSEYTVINKMQDIVLKKGTPLNGDTYSSYNKS